MRDHEENTIVWGFAIKAELSLGGAEGDRWFGVKRQGGGKGLQDGD